MKKVLLFLVVLAVLVLVAKGIVNPDGSFQVPGAML